MTFVMAIRFISSWPISVTKVICYFEEFRYSVLQPRQGSVYGSMQWSGGGSFEHLCVFRNDYRQCDHRIPPVEVISGSRIYQWFVPHVVPFEVRCEKCGFVRT